jgi:hypothetical protein
MERRIFHGDITPDEVAQALTAFFDRYNLLTQAFRGDKRIIVQIASRPGAPSGGPTSIAVILEEEEDGLAVQIGEQAWFGVAASLGVTILSAWRNPFNLITRLDDIAQDIESIQINDQVWEVIENVATLKGATFELSERLKRMACEYCGTANPVGQPSCIACGAPLGNVQPSTCPKCGFVLKNNELICPNCNNPTR